MRSIATLQMSSESIRPTFGKCFALSAAGAAQARLHTMHAVRPLRVPGPGSYGLAGARCAGTVVQAQGVQQVGPCSGSCCVGSQLRFSDQHSGVRAAFHLDLSCCHFLMLPRNRLLLREDYHQPRRIVPPSLTRSVRLPAERDRRQFNAFALPHPEPPGASQLPRRGAHLQARMGAGLNDFHGMLGPRHWGLKELQGCLSAVQCLHPTRASLVSAGY